jgi:hypothetical protein
MFENDFLRAFNGITFTWEVNVAFKQAENLMLDNRWSFLMEVAVNNEEELVSKVQEL